MTRSQISHIVQRVFTEERIPQEGTTTLSRVYAAIVDHIGSASAGRRAPLIVGICGSQGAGKSTIARVVAEALQEMHRQSVAVLSLDDLYLPSGARAQLAREVHPLLETRGVPGTHDVELGIKVIQSLVNASPADETRIPRFNKAFDEPRPRDEWDIHRGRADVVILEGWCVGAVAETESALSQPINELEHVDDADGTWRRFVNAQLAGRYQALFGLLNLLIMIRVPGFEYVRSWRALQERKLAQKLRLQGAASDSAKVMTEVEVGRFIVHYERLTRHTLAEMPARADIVVELDGQRRVASVLLRFDR